MTTWLAGMRITPDRLADETVVKQSVGATAASGFSLFLFEGWKTRGVACFRIICTRSGADIPEIAVRTGNILDTDLATLPVGWRPPERVNTVWGNGINDGEASISTMGLITLRSTSGTAGLSNGSFCRVYGSWICEDPN